MVAYPLDPLFRPGKCLPCSLCVYWCHSRRSHCIWGGEGSFDRIEEGMDLVRQCLLLRHLQWVDWRRGLRMALYVL